MTKAATKPTIAVIGLGLMGAPMAQMLLADGYTVYGANRSPEPRRQHAAAGGVDAATFEEAAEAADIVITCLRTGEAVEQAYERLAGVARTTQIYVDHSTIDVKLARRCAELIEPSGAMFYDAPVSGGPPAIHAKTLTVMVGGPSDQFDRVREAFNAYAGRIELCGPVGAGSVMKMLNQVLVGIDSAAAAEAFALARALDTDLEQVGSLISTSAGSSFMFRRNWPMMVNSDYAGVGRVATMIKDLRYGADAAAAAGLDLPLLTAAVSQFERAIDAGLEEQDNAVVARVVQPESRPA